jgi:hypothetical protein
MGSNLHRHAACDLRHRFQQRQRAIVGRHRFICDAGRAGFHQAFGLRLVGREVQIGEQQVARLQHRDLGRLRLLHLHDHIALREDGRGIGSDRGAGIDIILILEVDAKAGAGLKRNLMARGGQFGDGCGGQAHAIFVILDFPGNTDAHDHLLKLMPGE